MISIGLTGSIAMGKSEVSRILQKHGLPVFDADHEVHALYNSQAGVDLLKPYVPEAIVNGKIDRVALTKIVMADPQRLNTLEKIVHDEIAKRRSTFKINAEDQGHAFAVFDIPLLFEKNLESSIDVSIVVSAPPHLQQQRALARPGMTEEKFEMILSRQMSDAEKRKRADHIIENDGTLEDLSNRTLACLAQIKREHAL
jgi:dephospho-CoA kinase